MSSMSSEECGLERPEETHTRWTWTAQKLFRNNFSLNNFENIEAAVKGKTFNVKCVRTDLEH